jgi:hypothetical protein
LADLNAGQATLGIRPGLGSRQVPIDKSMIRKRGYWFSKKIMLNQKDSATESAALR